MDRALKFEAQQYGTLLHGDVKGANIFFSRRPDIDSSSPRKCALYDFQYVGVGLVTRDLVYFLGTSVQNALVWQAGHEKDLLRTYHAKLVQAMRGRQDSHVTLQNHPEYTFDTLWVHWELAIVDWYRFMAGWGFWGNDSWIARRAKEITTEWTQRGFSCTIAA